MDPNARQQLLATLTSRVARTEPVEVAGFGTVYVREMTALERDAFELSIERDRSDDQPVNYRGRFLTATLCDEQGNLLFTAEDADQLAGVPVGGDMQKLFRVASRLNALDAAEEKELEGNSAAPTLDGSS